MNPAITLPPSITPVAILYFMALRRAPLMWRVLTLGWMALNWALIGLAYWNGMPT